MKSIFYHPMYRKSVIVFWLIGFGIILADACGYIPGDIPRGNVTTLVMKYMTLPLIAGNLYDLYIWLKQKIQHRQENA